MNLPQEVVVWRVIPSLRKEFVLGLKKKRLSQKEIAAKLGITAAAVSQYMNNKRATSIVAFNAKSRVEIQKAVDRIAKTSRAKTSMQELSRVIEYCRRQRVLCPTCDIRKNNCDICFG